MIPTNDTDIIFQPSSTSILLIPSNKLSLKDQGIIFNLVIVMTTSAMGRNCVVLSLAMCLVLSSFHDVSCQVSNTQVTKEQETEDHQAN
ncbi:hypothetical protein YC2023_038888 [Brassica napus]